MELFAKNAVSNIPLKTSIDILHIKKACKIVEELLITLGAQVKPGKKTSEIDSFCADFITKRKGYCALKGYMGFPGNACISVNNVAAHGIGSNYVIQDGDIVTVDVTVGVDGWNGDGAWTYIAGNATADKKILVKAAWKSMLAGISQAFSGRKLGDIGYAVNKTALEYKCRILQDLAGHGIGRGIHEPPVVFNIGKRGNGLYIVPGMVFTIEPILSLGSKKIKVAQDNWSILVDDGKPAAQFECTVAIFKNKTDILTLNSINLQKYIDFPPAF